MEAPPLSFDPWYLSPPKEANDIVHSDYYIKHGEKKAIRRKIYEKVEYDEFEKTNIAEFKRYLATKNVVVPPGFKESSYLKMLMSGKFNMEKSLKALNSHVLWINTPKMHYLDKQATEFLAQGNVYLCGRDKQFRPVIYMNCENLNLKKQGADNITQAMCVFLEMVKYNMFVDGKVENWRFIIDTKEKGVLDLPLKALGVIIDIMQVNFGGHLEKLYILNPSFGLSTMWSVIEKMIDEEAAQKIKFVKKKKLNELLEDIDAKYLQQKYSGTLENLTQFWPPIDIYSSDQQKQAHNDKLAEKNKPIVVTSPAPPVQQQEIFIETQVNNMPVIEHQSPHAVKASPQEEGSRKNSQDVQESHHNKSIVSENKQNQSARQSNKPDEVVAEQNRKQSQATESPSTPKVQESKQPNYGSFEIKINKVEDVAFEYSNQNPYNEIPPAKVQTAIATDANVVNALIGGGNETAEVNTASSAADKFKEIEKGVVLIHEEEEQGEFVDGTDGETFLKQSKKMPVYSKNEEFLQEDMKLIEIDDGKEPSTKGGCCGTNSSCNIF